MIAGHSFTDPITHRCTCGRSFADISSARPEHIGKPGWAHSGDLTHPGLLEITAEVERQWSLLVGVATGSGPVAENVSSTDLDSGTVLS